MAHKPLNIYIYIYIRQRALRHHGRVSEAIFSFCSVAFCSYSDLLLLYAWSDLICYCHLLFILICSDEFRSVLICSVLISSELFESVQF